MRTFVEVIIQIQFYEKSNYGFDCTFDNGEG
jgi:hypothetical protein